jgi:Citrate synthase
MSDTGFARATWSKRRNAISRTVGWQEMVTNPEQKITRPRQIFVGHPRRELPKQKA